MPTFETLVREVLDSFVGAWQVPYPREGGAVEHFYDLFVPSGMGGVVSLWVEGDRCEASLYGSECDPIGPDVDPEEGAAQLRREVEKIVAQPRAVWVDSPGARAFAAKHLTREAVTARCLERGEPAPKFIDRNTETHRGYVDQAAWRKLRDLRFDADEQREAELAS